MDLEISGRVAVVTGASAGIGLAVAQEFLANDVAVVIAARDVSRLRAAETALLEQRSAKVASIAVDVSAPDAAECAPAGPQGGLRLRLIRPRS